MEIVTEMKVWAHVGTEDAISALNVIWKCCQIVCNSGLQSDRKQQECGEMTAVVFVIKVKNGQFHVKIK